MFSELSGHSDKSISYFQSGHIFVYTGLLVQCKNDDQLAIILGHEIAHSLLDHTVRFQKIKMPKALIKQTSLF